MDDEIISSSLLSEIAELHAEVDPAHNYKHLVSVAEGVRTALCSSRYDHLAIWQRNALVAAAYLHEVDDPKLHLSLGSNQSNAEYLLRKHGHSDQFIKLTLQIINLVSTRHNHNTLVLEEEKWKLLVRDSDRDQALGEIGIARCYAYTQAIGNPLFVEETPRCKSLDEVHREANPDRFARYNGTSKSMLDHFFDKLLHLDTIGSDDDYFKQQAELKMRKVVDFVISFGLTGNVNTDYLDALRRKYC